MEKENTNNNKAEIAGDKKNQTITKVANDEGKEEVSKRDKFFNRVSQKIESLVLKKAVKERSAAEPKKEGAAGKIPLNWKKLIPFSPLLIIIIFALYVQLFSKGKPESANVTAHPTPTYSPFPKFKPSVYADDPVVIALEETVSVLGREMATTPLTENTLTLPVLDFEISF